MTLALAARRTPHEREMRKRRPTMIRLPCASTQGKGMPDEGHYTVCLRCRTVERRPAVALTQRRIVRARTGELLVTAAQPGGCRVCGEIRAELRWGIPPADALPWSAGDPRARSWRSRHGGPFRL
jgi:hypothetical protein